MRFTDKNMEEGSIGGSSHFKFTGIRTEHLGASEYTLVNIAVDVTGSVQGFENELRECLIKAVDSCKKSPRSENLLIRVFLFSDRFPNGIYEVHGFKQLADIVTADYPAFQTGGGTPLYDATYSAIGATNAYAEKLYADDFMSNAINFIITDGDDNTSSMSPTEIRKEIDRGVKGEFIESDIIVLIGINATQYASRLQAFQQKANIDKFIDAGDATPGKLAKLGEFVSQSISSQSQAMGTGGPSQNISNVI